MSNMKTRTGRQIVKSPSSAKKERPRSRSRSRPRSKSPGRSLHIIPSSEDVENVQKKILQVVKKTRHQSPSRHSARLQEKDDHTKINAEPLLSLEDTQVIKSTGMYYGGVLGALIWPILLPAILLLSAIYSKKPDPIKKVYSLPQKPSDFYNLTVIQSVGAWVAFQLFLTYIPIGKLAGGQIRHESRLIYRCNGLFSFIVNAVGFGILYKTKSFNLSQLYNHWLEFTATLIVLAFLLSFIVFVVSLKCSKYERSVDGSSKWGIYNFLVGHQLNPRLFHLDLKMFCIRFGMMTWLALDVICVLPILDSHRQLTPTLIVLLCFHALYVADSLFHEETFLMSSTVNHDGLGFLMVFGSVAWMPLLFSMPVRFIVENELTQAGYCLGVICLVNMIGFIIYRGSNSQKNDFRRDPNNLAFSTTETLISMTGKKLIVDGWWGLVRHPHYLGDIIMAASWTMTTGGKFALPWLYIAYLFVHLLHRMYRDERNSARKYEHTWKMYCSRVRSLLIPKVF